MAKYLDNDGLLYLWQKIKTKFATITDLDGKVDKVTGKGLSTNDYTTAEKNKLNDVASGAQVNVIETIKVNDTALTPSSKTVNITVPTKTSDITNDSGFITTADIPEGAAASTTTPKMDGTAAVGTEMAFARGDHVHPSDTSRVPTTRKVAGHALSTDVTLVKSDVGLGNVDNTADVDKPISTAQQTALNDKVDKVTGKGLSTNDYTTAEKDKLNGIEAGAQVNTKIIADGNPREIIRYILDDDNGALIIDYNDPSPDGGLIAVPLASAAQDAIESLSAALAGKVDAEDGKGLSTNDYTTAEKNKLAAFGAASTYALKTDITNFATKDALNDKVDKETGYGLASVANATGTIYSEIGLTGDDFCEVNVYKEGAANKGKMLNEVGVGTLMRLTNTAMLQKADADSVYTKSEVYTKTEMDTAMNGALTTVQGMISSAVTNMYKYKGSVATVSALPSSDNTTGDVYNVEATGMNYAWNGTAWDALGEIFTITSISNSEIDTIVAS